VSQPALITFQAMRDDRAMRSSISKSFRPHSVLQCSQPYPDFLPFLLIPLACP
jgi:hypothetical protein